MRQKRSRANVAAGGWHLDAAAFEALAALA